VYIILVFVAPPFAASRISLIMSVLLLYLMPFAQWGIRKMINNFVMKVMKSQEK
jgi:hypothetical protein